MSEYEFTELNMNPAAAARQTAFLWVEDTRVRLSATAWRALGSPQRVRVATDASNAAFLVMAAPEGRKLSKKQFTVGVSVPKAMPKGRYLMTEPGIFLFSGETDSLLGQGHAEDEKMMQELESN